MTQQVDRDNEAEALTAGLKYVPDPNHPEKTKTASKSYQLQEAVPVRNVREVNDTVTKIDKEI